MINYYSNYLSIIIILRFSNILVYSLWWDFFFYYSFDIIYDVCFFGLFPPEDVREEDKKEKPKGVKKFGRLAKSFAAAVISVID